MAAVATGILYAIGGSVVYVALGALLVASVPAAPSVSHWLQKYMNKILGPLLILVGMILLDLISMGSFGAGLGERVGSASRAEVSGLVWRWTSSSRFFSVRHLRHCCSAAWCRCQSNVNHPGCSPRCTARAPLFWPSSSRSRSRWEPRPSGRHLTVSVYSSAGLVASPESSSSASVSTSH